MDEQMEMFPDIRGRELMNSGKVVERPETLIFRFKEHVEVAISIDAGGRMFRMSAGIISISLPASVVVFQKLLPWLKRAKEYSSSLDNLTEAKHGSKGVGN